MNRIACLSAALLAGTLACSGKDGANGNNGRTSLVRLEAVPPGANCANGGTAVEEGLDTNGNGLLDDSEVDAAETRYVCNGAAGPTGPSGNAGDAGSSGYNELVKVTPESPGANCQYGGQRIDIGLDLNRDGVLQASEITSTTYSCQNSELAGYYFGDIHISRAEDLSLLTGIKVLVGSLYFDAAFGSALSLPELQRVTGIIDMEVGIGGNTRAVHTSPDLVGLLSVSFPALVQASQIYIIGQEDLTSISFPALASVDIVDFENNQLVTAIDFSSLARVARTFLIYGETALTTFSLPKLAYAVNIDIGLNPALTSLSFPALASSGGQVAVHDDPSLASISFPVLASLDHLEIDANPALVSLTAPLLRKVASRFSVNNNAQLDSCAVDRLVVALDALPAVDVVSNAASPTCTASDMCKVLAISGVTGHISWCIPTLSYSAAESLCQTLGAGGHLAWFESAAEWNAVSAAAIASAFPGDAWIGYSDAASEGNWVAASGFTAYNPAMPVTNNSFWQPGEPNGGTNENCAMLYQQGTVNDTTCASVINNELCRVPLAASRD